MPGPLFVLTWFFAADISPMLKEEDEIGRHCLSVAFLFPSLVGGKKREEGGKTITASSCELEALDRRSLLTARGR